MFLTGAQGVVLGFTFSFSCFFSFPFRSRFAIIPQDPFLFSGSVRENLDPTNRYSDQEVWTVLDKCHLKEAALKLGGLIGDVGERGQNLSVGQKQLVCLARALLTRAKVIAITILTICLIVSLSLSFPPPHSFNSNPMTNNYMFIHSFSKLRKCW